jgi:hypothetical protein
VHIGSPPLLLPIAGSLAILLTSCLGRFERPNIPGVIAVPAPDGKTGNYTLQNYADDLADYDNKTGEAAAAVRNKIVYSLMAEIDYVFYDYETKLFLNEGLSHVGADFLQLGMAAGGTLTNGTRGKTILSALLAGVTGVDLSVDKNVFRQQTVQAITNSMEGNRDRIKTIIIQQLDQTTTSYPYPAARADLIHYFFAGTLPGGLQQLNQDAGSNAKSEKAALNQVQVGHITPGDVSNITTINAAIAKAFSDNKLGPVADYLTAMGITTPPNPTKAMLETELGQFGAKLPVDADLRRQSYEAAKTAKLIQ